MREIQVLKKEGTIAMRIADRVEGEKLIETARVAGLLCVGAAMMLAATPLMAQERSGVSNPAPVVITASNGLSTVCINARPTHLTPQ